MQIDKSVMRTAEAEFWLTESIRTANLSDIPRILEIYAPFVEKSTYSFEYTTPSLEDFEQRFIEHIMHCPWLVFEEGGEVLGYAYAGPAFTRAAYQWCAEISVYIDSKYHRRKIGEKLYAALEKLLEKQGYKVIYALITTENKISMDFHVRLGYTITAQFPNCGFKFDRWHGVTWMEKRIGSSAKPSGFPLPWPALLCEMQK